MTIMYDVNQLKILRDDADKTLSDIYDALYVISNAGNILEHKRSDLNDISTQIDANSFAFNSEHNLDISELNTAKTHIEMAIVLLDSYISKSRRSEEYQKEYYDKESSEVTARVK